MMRDAQPHCPNCGADLNVHNPGIMMVACEHCSNLVYFSEQQLDVAGRAAHLAEGFTRLYRGALGTLAGRRFRVLGRLRYAFARGFWDEWYIEFDAGEAAWITEDNHELSLEQEVQGTEVVPFEALTPGQSLPAGRPAEFIIEEVGEAECIGAEGQLPLAVQLGEKYRFADGSSPDGRRCLGLEYDKQPPTVFHGRWLDAAELRLDDEGDDW
jgi:hypothetical protein